MTLDEALRRPTISVIEAGALFYGLGRSASYEAAKSGDLPTVKIGRKLRVPVVPVAEKLGLKAQVGRA